MCDIPTTICLVLLKYFLSSLESDKLHYLKAGN
jgi:hypothetical protein